MTAKQNVNMVSVTVDESVNGRFEVTPALPADGQVPAGTALTLKASPDPGYALDSVYYSFTGHVGWTLYAESMNPVFEFEVNRDIHVGASFIEPSELEGFKVIQDVVYARPGVKPLKYDVYSPNGAENLPGIIIIHGGGWAANTEDIMRGLARELVRSGDYVVFSIDYRWIGNLDGDTEPNTRADLIEDVFGAIAHIQEHAEPYGADPGRIGVTGDSAGGHLSAAAATMADRIGDRGFGVIDGIYEYRPSYMPEDKTISQVRDEICEAIKAAAPSYGVFGGKMLRPPDGKPEAWGKAIAPMENIPDPEDRLIPHYLLRGTRDWLIKHEAVQAYADALRKAGQPVQYVQAEGAGHAFFDWKPDPKVKETFRRFGVPHAAGMKSFFDTVFCPETQESTGHK